MWRVVEHRAHQVVHRRIENHKRFPGVRLRIHHAGEEHTGFRDNGPPGLEQNLHAKRPGNFRNHPAVVGPRSRVLAGVAHTQAAAHLQNAFDLTDRGVSGRDAPKALDAFVFTERGVYRSGETVFVTSLLRDAKGVAVSGLPLTLVAQRPDGVEYKRVVLADQGQGGRAYALPLLPGAPPGTWRIQLYADPKTPSIGETSFLLEDYVPERLDVQLKPAQPILSQGEPAEIGVDAKFLYGAPAAGLDVTGSITVQAVDGAALAGFPGYAAGLADDEFEAVTNQLDAKVQTDEKGHADVSIDLPDASAAKPLEAKIVLRVAEPGGRAVERVVTLTIRAKSTLIGVKKDFGEDLGEGQPALFEAIAVAPDGSRVARKGVEWSLYKLDNDYQWYNR